MDRGHWIDFTRIYSASKLNLFDQCSKAYYFTYVDPILSKKKRELKELPKNIWDFNTVGHAVHNAITLFYYLPTDKRSESNLLNYLKITWFSEIKPEIKPPLGIWGGFKTIEIEREQYKEAVNMLKTFYKIAELDPTIEFLPTNNFKYGIEDYKKLITPINDLFDISGKFDLVLLNNDTLHIVDYKTSKKDSSNQFQLKFYKALAEKKLKKLVTKVSFYYLRSGKIADIDLSQFNTDVIIQEISDKVNQILSEKIFLAKPSNLCKYCIFKDYCPSNDRIDVISQNTSSLETPEDLPF